MTASPTAGLPMQPEPGVGPGVGVAEPAGVGETGGEPAPPARPPAEEQPEVATATQTTPGREDLVDTRDGTKHAPYRRRREHAPGEPCAAHGFFQPAMCDRPVACAKRGPLQACAVAR